MTLIVFHKGTLVSDSRETADYAIINEESKKIYEYKKWALAATGLSQDCAWFYAWLESGFKLKSPPKWDDGSEAVLIDKEEHHVYRVYMNGTKEQLDEHEPYIAGSEPTAGLILLKEYGLPPEDVIKLIAEYNGEVNNRIQKVKCW